MGNRTLSKTVQILWILVASVLLLAAGDQETRFQTLGHKMMCRCGCSQILLECNHVGCSYSDKMRNELAAAINGARAAARAGGAAMG